MACNPIRFLGECVFDRTLTLETMKHGLGYSKVGDCMAWEHWHALNNAETAGEFREMAYNLLPHYYAEYARLEQPRTAEEWYARLYAVA